MLLRVLLNSRHSSMFFISFPHFPSVSFQFHVDLIKDQVIRCHSHSPALRLFAETRFTAFLMSFLPGNTGMLVIKTACSRVDSSVNCGHEQCTISMPWTNKKGKNWIQAERVCFHFLPMHSTVCVCV